MYRTKKSRAFIAALVAIYLVDLAVFCYARGNPVSGMIFNILSAAVAVNLALYTVSRGAELFKGTAGPGGRMFARRVVRVVFHASMLVSMAGGLATAFTRESSVARVSEGYYSSLEKHGFGKKANSCLFVDVRGKMRKPSRTRYELLGGPTNASYSKSSLLAADTVVTVFGGGGARRFSLTYNNPAKLDGGKLFMGDTGYTAVLHYLDVVSGKTGKNLLLFELPKKNSELDAVDSFIPKSGIKISSELVPDASDKDSFELGSPMLRLIVTSGGTIIFEGGLPRGTELDLGRYRLYFEKVDNWADLIYVSDKGVGLVYAGLAGITLSAFAFMVLMHTGTWGVHVKKSAGDPRGVGGAGFGAARAGRTSDD